ncbi:MAG: cation:proton antiporter [Ignavibacteria bacterium]|nr:cation:proton antiporter [Ignavibacteria bacterium]
MKLSSHDITHLLILIALLLSVARASGELFRLIKQPVIIGEIIAGIILGPSVLGHLYPGWYADLFVKSPTVSVALDGLVQIALVMLLLIYGLEVDLSMVMKQGKTAFLTSIMSFAVPFICGFAGGFFAPGLLGAGPNVNPLVFGLFLGVAFSITALPVVARTLMDLGLFKSNIGSTIIASAMGIDFIGWLIFSVILGLLGKEITPFGFTGTFLVTIVFVVFLLVFGRKLINRLLPFIQSKFSFPGGVLNFVLILGFFGAAFTEYIGIHAIFGAFIIGMAIGDSPHLREQTREIIQQFVTNIFAPLFFISIGLKADFIGNFNLFYVVLFIGVAFVTKIAGSMAGAIWGGLRKNDALIVGFGMNSRGAMEIILGLLALQYKVIGEEVFVTLVLMALVTSLSSAPLMSYFMNRSSVLIKAAGLLKPRHVIVSRAVSVQGVIEELATVAARSVKLSKDLIYQQVYAREVDLPTGLANGIAIPHARVQVNAPYMALAYVPDGLDFGALDQIPARWVFLLLTPNNENETQLELLASVARLAEEIGTVRLAPVPESKDIHHAVTALLAKNA